MSKFKVGDKVYVVPRVRYANWSRGEAEVISVGRRWVTISDPKMSWKKERFDPSTMTVDGKGYTTTISVYRTKEDWENEKWRGDVSRALKKACDGWGKLPYTSEQMVAALTALGVPLPEHPSAEKEGKE